MLKVVKWAVLQVGGNIRTWSIRFYNFRSYCSRQPSFFSVSLISSPLGRQLYQCRLSIPLILLDREKRQSKNNDIFCFLPFFYIVLDTTTFISNKVARLQKWKPKTTKLHFLSENSTFRVKIQIFGYKMSNQSWSKMSILVKM